MNIFKTLLLSLLFLVMHDVNGLSNREREQLKWVIFKHFECLPDAHIINLYNVILDKAAKNNEKVSKKRSKIQKIQLRLIEENQRVNEPNLTECLKAMLTSQNDKLVALLLSINLLSASTQE